MERATFWDLIDDTRRVSDEDPALHARTLSRRLERLPRDEIMCFERLWRAYDAAAYRWDLWAAAYLLNGGCDEDCFAHFRSYVIGLGKEVYGRALADADSLVILAKGPCTYQFAYDAEGLGYVALDAYLAAHGADMPEDDLPDLLPDEPLGEPWDIEAPETVVPRIAAAVGWLEA